MQQSQSSACVPYSRQPQVVSLCNANKKYTRNRMRMRQAALQKRRPDPLWVAVLRKSRPQGAGTTIFERRVSGQKPVDDCLNNNDKKEIPEKGERLG
jgi:hypothetical protein